MFHTILFKTNTVSYNITDQLLTARSGSKGCGFVVIVVTIIITVPVITM